MTFPVNDSGDSTLCADCSVIERMDQYHEVQDIKLPNGETVLTSAGEIPLNYEKQDSFPALPGLEDSATQGCGFCRFLRKSIREEFADEMEDMLRHDLHSQDLIMEKMSYVLRPYDGKRFSGVQVLAMKVIFGSGRTSFVRFDVLSAQGICTLILETKLTVAT
jgi:hypothetical protein